jgi:hypothetical protein
LQSVSADELLVFSQFEDDETFLGLDMENEEDVDDPGVPVKDEESLPTVDTKEEAEQPAQEIPAVVTAPKPRRTTHKTSPRLSTKNEEEEPEVPKPVTRKTNNKLTLKLKKKKSSKNILSKTALSLKKNSSRVLRVRKEPMTQSNIEGRSSRGRHLKATEKASKLRAASLEKVALKTTKLTKTETKTETTNGVAKVESTPERPTKRQITMTPDQMRAKVGILLQKISTPERLQSLGFGVRVIDDVLHESIVTSGRKPCDEKLPLQERLRKNVDILLEWTIPAEFMVKFRQEKRTTEELLEELAS